MSWKHCDVHGDYVVSDTFGIMPGCPDCLREAEDAQGHRERMLEEAERAREEAQLMREEAAERAEEDRKERRRIAAEAEHKRANPGDYECPNCGYITLKRGRPRCPTCQGTVSPEFWPAIYDAERKIAERRKAEELLKAEEWERTRPERERQAAEARRKAERATEEAQRQAAEARGKAERATEDARQRQLAERRWKVLGYCLVPVSWVVGGYIGWACAHWYFADQGLKVLLGIPAAGLAAIVGQRVVMMVFKFGD
jgi:rubrerythrin